MLSEHISCFIINNKCADMGTDFNFPNKCPHCVCMTKSPCYRQTAQTIPTNSIILCAKRKQASGFSYIMGEQYNNPSCFLFRSHQVRYTVDFNLLFKVQLHDALDTFKHLHIHLCRKRCCGCISSVFWFRYRQREFFK